MWRPRGDGEEPVNSTRERRVSNLLAGVLIPAAFATYAVLVDPFELGDSHVQWNADRDWLTFCMFAGVTSVLSYSLFARPFVIIEPNRVTIQNPFSRIVLPVQAIEDVDVGLFYVSIRTAGRRFRILSAEVAIPPEIESRLGVAGRILRLARTAQIGEYATGVEAIKTRYAPNLAQVLIVLFWTANGAASLIR